MSRRRNKIRSASAGFNIFNGKRNPRKKKSKEDRVSKTRKNSDET